VWDLVAINEDIAVDIAVGFSDIVR